MKIFILFIIFTININHLLLNTFTPSSVFAQNGGKSGAQPDAPSTGGKSGAQPDAPSTGGKSGAQSQIQSQSQPQVQIAPSCPPAGCPAAGIIQVQELMTRMINISVTLAFMAMTVWLAWSAIKFFITSGGDPKALAQAWSSVTWIFMGIVFMILAYLALKLIASFTGVDVTKYCLGFPPYCI